MISGPNKILFYQSVARTSAASLHINCPLIHHLILNHSAVTHIITCFSPCLESVLLCLYLCIMCKLLLNRTQFHQLVNMASNQLQTTSYMLYIQNNIANNNSKLQWNLVACGHPSFVDSSLGPLGFPYVVNGHPDGDRDSIRLNIYPGHTRDPGVTLISQPVVHVHIVSLV